MPRANLIQTMLSSRSLIIGAAVCMAAALAWIGVIIRTYLIGRPAALDPGRRAIGALTVCCLCLLVAAPLGLRGEPGQLAAQPAGDAVPRR